MLLKIQDNVNECPTEAKMGGLPEGLLNKAAVHEDLHKLVEETQPEEEDYRDDHDDDKYGFLEKLEFDMKWDRNFKFSGDFRDSAITFGHYMLTQPIRCNEGLMTKDPVHIMKTQEFGTLQYKY